MELNEEAVKKALDWLDSLVGNSNDSEIALFTYQLLGILYDTCEELTEDNEWSAKRILEADKKVAELTEENERLRETTDNELRYTKELVETLHKVHEEKVQKAKADTVRMMQERLLEEIETGLLYEGTLLYYLIQKIAKEMLEGNNENHD